MDAVIVSNARTIDLYNLTVQAIETSGVNCVVVEQQKVDYDNALTLHYDFPFNYNKCLNLGYKHTTGNVAFCNNDLIFGKGWTGIEKHFDKYGSLSALNPGWGFHAGFTGIREGYNVGRELCGWCLIVSRETMEITGGFDEDVEFWCSDNIWAEELMYHGIKHALICDYEVKHLTSKTLGSGLPRELSSHYTGGQAAIFNEARKKYVK